MVHPLHLAVPEADLQDLRERLRRSRMPEAETVRGPGGGLDWSQGPPLEVVTEWVRYWQEGYDWRRLEGELNAHGQATTRIDGLDVHFLHVPSPRPDARPLVITHGWPSSVVEPMARLGHDRFFAAGGDWGGRVTTALGVHWPERVAGLHTFTPYVPEPAGGLAALGELTEAEDRWVADTRRFWRFGGDCSLQHYTRPQTVAYALVDSPLALLAWVLDEFWAWTDHSGDVEQAVSRDRVLDTVTLYWLTRSGGSSARFYWQNFPPGRSEPVTVPSAVSVFPADIEELPRRWVQTRFLDLRSWSEPARGGHFPMLEVPEAYAGEFRRALGPMPL